MPGVAPAMASLLPQSVLDLGLQHAVKVRFGDRPDQFVGDIAVAPDDEGFRHAADAPFHRGAPMAVRARRDERIAIASEETARIVGLVLVVDADDADALVLAQG